MKHIDPDGALGDQSARITKYAYSGDNLIAEYDRGDVMRARYLYSGAIDDLLVMTRDLNGDGQLGSDEDFFFYKNNLGSVTNILNGAAAEVKRYKYRAFGEMLDEWTSPSLSPNFIWKYRDRYHIK